MRVIANKALLDFAARHSRAGAPLQAWRKLVAAGDFSSFAHLKATFRSVDKAGEFYVFDIAGNHFRLVAAIHFDRQMLFIRHVFTHAEYDRWSPP